MGKIEDAKKILKALGIPSAQQNEISALTLLALCGLKSKDPWSKANRKSLTVTKGIMAFIAEHYQKLYAPNTRETFRRQVLHQFVQGRIADYNPDEPELPTNSPRAHYSLTVAALDAIRVFGTARWKIASRRFVSRQGTLLEIYRKERAARLVPVQLPGGHTLLLSPGKHNEVQAAVIRQFAPRFAPGAKLLYLGDTAKKNLFIDEGQLLALGIPITQHDKLPDVVLYDTKRGWLFLIEAVTSHGPMSPKRVYELEKMLTRCPIAKVFVTAFQNFNEFRKYIKDIAWETEVWIAEIPDHLIHYNGDKFLGPS
jgi:hypothetical protein